MPTKSAVAPSFHRQVILVFVCVPASLPRACSLPGERLAACCCWMSCVDVERVSLSEGLSETVEHVGRLVAAFTKVVCASGVFGLIISHYLNSLLDLILNTITPKTSAYYKLYSLWYDIDMWSIYFSASWNMCLSESIPLHHRTLVDDHHQYFSLQSHIHRELHHSHLHWHQCDYFFRSNQQQLTPMLVCFLSHWASDPRHGLSPLHFYLFVGHTKEMWIPTPKEAHF